MNNFDESDDCFAISRPDKEDRQAAKIILDIMKLANPPDDYEFQGLIPDVIESQTASRKEVFLIGLIPFVISVAICVITFIVPILVNPTIKIQAAKTIMILLIFFILYTHLL